MAPGAGEVSADQSPEKLVEAVARAIARDAGHNSTRWPQDANRYRSYARSAIAALQEQPAQVAGVVDAQREFGEKADFADALELQDDDYVEGAPIQARHYRALRSLATLSPVAPRPDLQAARDKVNDWLSENFNCGATEEEADKLLAALSEQEGKSVAPRPSEGEASR